MFFDKDFPFCAHYYLCPLKWEWENTIFYWDNLFIFMKRNIWRIIKDSLVFEDAWLVNCFLYDCARKRVIYFESVPMYNCCGIWLFSRSSRSRKSWLISLRPPKSWRGDIISCNRWTREASSSSRFYAWRKGKKFKNRKSKANKCYQFIGAKNFFFCHQQ